MLSNENEYAQEVPQLYNTLGVLYIARNLIATIFNPASFALAISKYCQFLYPIKSELL